jgi:poly-beta-1,6 N-acetyl-D-glucosamine synthase
MLQGLFNFILVASYCLLGLIVLKTIFFVSFSWRHSHAHTTKHPKRLTSYPLVTVIVPSYNESVTVANCVESLLSQTYKNIEILVVDDGSSDNTLAIAVGIAKKYKPKVNVFTKKNGGKASALNAGIRQAKGEIVVCIDADSMFLKDTVEQLVLSFQGDSDVAAVGGNVKVANRRNLLAKQQALEYITGLTLHRRTFAQLGCMQVISGAIGAFRRDAMLKVGGYSRDTIVEDMDNTIELVKRGYKVVYNPKAIAYTEAPEDLKSFMKQRYRWTFGGFEVLSKHRKAIWRWNGNLLGFLGLPYFLLFPWLDVFVSFMLVASVARIIITGDMDGVLLFYMLFGLLQVILTTYALAVDREDKKLSLLILLDSLFYYHLLTFTTVRAGINFLRKKKATWNKLERYGRNTLADAGAPVS